MIGLWPHVTDLIYVVNNHELPFRSQGNLRGEEIEPTDFMNPARDREERAKAVLVYLFPCQDVVPVHEIVPPRRDYLTKDQQNSEPCSSQAKCLGDLGFGQNYF